MCAYINTRLSIKTPFVSIIIILIHIILSKKTTLAVPDDWNHGCTKSYDQDGDMVWAMPENAVEGDVLILVVSRTDERIPLEIDGWKYGASCFKSGNDQKRCFTKKHCKQRKDGYCKWFTKGKGRDLATVVFFKKVKKKGSSLPKRFKYNIGGEREHPGWGFLLAVNGVDQSDPIRSIRTTSNDHSATSIFPSVKAKKGDLLLLSMAFDDKTKKSDFKPPVDTDLINFVSGNDEAGYLYYKKISSSGATGKLETQGKGGRDTKDALISLVLRGSEDGKNKNKNLRRRA